MLDAADQELSVFSKDVENAGKLAMETVKATLTKVASELCKNKVGIDFIADILTGLDMRTLLICLHPADGQFRFLREKAHNV